LPIPPNTLDEMRRDLDRLAVVRYLLIPRCERGLRCGTRRH
jgi:hypothetical protein